MKPKNQFLTEKQLSGLAKDVLAHYIGHKPFWQLKAPWLVKNVL